MSELWAYFDLYLVLRSATSWNNFSRYLLLLIYVIHDFIWPLSQFFCYTFAFSDLFKAFTKPWTVSIFFYKATNSTRYLHSDKQKNLYETQPIFPNLSNCCGSRKHFRKNLTNVPRFRTTFCGPEINLRCVIVTFVDLKVFHVNYRT